ncbi:MAG TPA: LUD domain-containing protein [Chloroflexota bacterium]|jgi:L-lactate dehydrogenase complex protein LldG
MRSSVARGTAQTSHVREFKLAAEAAGARVRSATSAEVNDLLVSYEAGSLEGGIGYSSDLLCVLGREIPTDRTIRPFTWISRGRLGIASTGTVLVAERLAEDRICALLSTQHVLVVPSDHIVATLDQTAGSVRALLSAGLGYVTFTTGPSRTSDIEKVLTLGAHGPAQLDIILVEGWEPHDD